MYHAMFGQMRKQLAQLDKWLDTAAAYAKTRSFDPDVFLTLRLAPDQFPFDRQVQLVCDTAKLAASRLTGKDAPVHADTEQTLVRDLEASDRTGTRLLDELRARVTAVIGYLDGFSARDFDTAATRVITQPRWEGKTMSGASYFLEHAVPNFFFHLTHVYAILRHNGVGLGKRDYLGPLSFTAPS